jgi:hypothetical protein
MLNPAILQSNLELDNLLSGDKFLLESKKNDYTYYKRDFLFRFGRWRGALVMPLYTDPRKYLGRKLVVGHSDIKLDFRQLMFLRAMGVSQVFSVNSVPWKSFALSLPLGLSNDSNESDLHRVLGNRGHLTEANARSDFPSSFLNSIYANFSSENNLVARNELLRIIRNRQNVVFDVPVFTNSGRVEYLTKLRTHNFVLCPEGNGVDTHRLWETLYMGGIPIIKASPYMNTLVKNLPVLIVDEWKQILDTNFLEQAYFRIKNGSFNYDKLFWPYWRHLISGVCFE